jgi:O-antigen/teichoic acid export membrane protein
LTIANPTEGRGPQPNLAAEQEGLDALSADHLRADLKGHSLRGGVWTIGSQGAQLVLQSLSTVVLARLLTPADFGIVAMVTAITVFGQAFADLGLSEATIQSTEINHDQVSSLFWVNFAIGVGLTVVTILLAPVFVWFYREPRLEHITLWLSLTFLIGGLRVQHTALLKRQMRFKSLAFRDVSSALVGVFVAIVIAWRHGGYWALVAFPLTWNLTQMVLSWVLVKWTPGLPKRGTNVRSFLTFGGNVAASYVITNVATNADNVLIGWYWGAAPLGLYSRAYNLLTLPVRQLNIPIGSVAFPTLSRIQNEPERFARYYLQAIKLVMWPGAAIFGFLFVAARPVIIIALGKQWLQAAPIFQILAISAMAQLVFESIMWILISRGQSARLLKLMAVVAPIMVCSFAIGLPFGAKGVAWGGSLTLAFAIPWMLRYAFHGTALTLRSFGQAVWVPITLCLVSVCAAEVVCRLVAPQNPLWHLLLVALVFAVTYALSIAIRPVRQDLPPFRELLSELRLSMR